MKDSKHKLIVDVARRLYSERLSTEISMEEIANEAGVARSTIYVYFESRDELLRACLHTMYEDLRMAIETSTPLTPLDPSVALQSLIEGLFICIDSSASFFRLAVATQAVATNPGAAAVGAELSLIGLGVQEMLEGIVKDGMAASHFRELDPVRTAALIGQHIFGALSVRAAESCPETPAKASAELTTFLLRGLHFETESRETQELTQLSSPSVIGDSV